MNETIFFSLLARPATRQGDGRKVVNGKIHFSRDLCQETICTSAHNGFQLKLLKIYMGSIYMEQLVYMIRLQFGG